jgi:hypothetical protein
VIDKNHYALEDLPKLDEPPGLPNKANGILLIWSDMAIRAVAVGVSVLAAEIQILCMSEICKTIARRSRSGYTKSISL